MAIKTFKLDKTTKIMVETVTYVDEVQPAEGTAGKAIGAFKDQIGPVSAVAKAFRDAIRAADPDKVEVSFGLELGGTASIPLITSGEAKGNFRIVICWEKEKR